MKFGGLRDLVFWIDLGVFCLKFRCLELYGGFIVDLTAWVGFFWLSDFGFVVFGGLFLFLRCW